MAQWICVCLPSRVRVPSTSSRFLSLMVIFVPYFLCENNENKQKEAGFSPFKNHWVKFRLHSVGRCQPSWRSVFIGFFSRKKIWIGVENEDLCHRVVTLLLSTHSLPFYLFLSLSLLRSLEGRKSLTTLRLPSLNNNNCCSTLYQLLRATNGPSGLADGNSAPDIRTTLSR